MLEDEKSDHQAKMSPVKANPCYKMSFIGGVRTNMSDDSCIWCQALVKLRQEAGRM
jgi:hypothetical protein